MRLNNIKAILLGLCCFTSLVMGRPAYAEKSPVLPTHIIQKPWYQRVRPNILQIRILLNNKESQSGAGSGFFASPEGLIVTNYHVVSELALEPKNHYAVFTAPDGKEGALELLAVDVIHDLAIMRIPGMVQHEALELASDTEQLTEGEHLYSIGNPLDIGFAITEGAYNGFVRRQLSPRYFFSGALSAGMSGGPALNSKGQVIGVNVASRTDGELVSFLVPIHFAKTLLKKVQHSASPIKTPAYDNVGRQLIDYQQELTQTWLSQPARFRQFGHYRVPLPQEKQARCWGESDTDAPFKEFIIEFMSCKMESTLFTGKEKVGRINMSYEFYDGTRQETVRFLNNYSTSFANEAFGEDNQFYTTPRCHERTIQQQHAVLKAVICLRGHRKFKGLIDASIIMAPLNQPKQGLLGRFDVIGVSFDNGMKLIEHYIKGFSWVS